MSDAHHSPVQLFVSRRGHYLGFLRVLCRDAQMAEELFQELAVAVMEASARYDPGRNFDAWVRGIARNLFRESLRKSGREIPAGDPELVEAIGAAYESVATRESAADATAGERLRQCMDRLPDHHREYIRDRYERQLSSKQIAEMYRKTVSAVDTLMSRIRAALLDCMKRGREALV